MLILLLNFSFSAPVQASLAVVTGPAPGIPQLEGGAVGRILAAVIKSSQPWGLRVVVALLQQPHILLRAQKWGASSGMSGAVSKGSTAVAAGCYESCLGCAIL